MNISIVDTTLREGNQCPGVNFDSKQSLEIVDALVKCNIGCIEIGHPYVNENEYKRVKTVVENYPNFSILAHARAKKEDIDTVKETGTDWIGIFVGVNKKSRDNKLNKRSFGHVLKLIKDSITYAKSLNLKVRYTAEDSSRTNILLLLQAYRVAIEAGADRICYSDSVGCDNPDTIGKKIYKIKNNFPLTALEVHCHNDRGLALANSLSAIKSGATWISTSVNGIGERCGITDTVSLIANLYYEYSIKLPEKNNLKNLSKLVSAITRQYINNQHPVVGVNAFKHKAKLHIDAVKKDEDTYSWIKPTLFGRKTEIEDEILPTNFNDLLISPEIISATELKYHRHGPGSRFVMLDNRFVPDCRAYCIVREVKNIDKFEQPHVDSHRHWVDSLFVFIGDEDNMKGLKAMVILGEKHIELISPASVFIPAGIEHSYYFISGSGKFMNFVLAGNYNKSLLEKENENVA